MSEALKRVRRDAPAGQAAPAAPPSRAGWLLYDGACGFCARWVPFWGPTLRRRGIETAPLQTAWVAPVLGLGRGEEIDDLRLLLPDGRHLEGADVYRHVMRRIWWARPLWLLAVTPGLRRIFDAAYRAFADNRYRFSRACGLKPPVETGWREDGS